MTVWSFGCSHAAGHELQLDLTQKDMLAFYHKHGFKDWYDLWNCTDEKKKSKFYKKWARQLGRNDHNPNLAYPGIVAKLKDTELKNYAMSGSGIDYSYDQFLKNKKHFKQNDIVLFELPPTLRYQGSTGEIIQVAYTSQVIQEYIPNSFILEEFYKLVVNEIKDFAYCIHIYCKTADQMMLNVHKSNSISLHEMSEKYNHVRYPFAHYHYDTQKLFAEYLVKEVIK